MKRTPFSRGTRQLKQWEWRRRPLGKKGKTPPSLREASSKPPKPLIWSDAVADAKFSLYIRERDGKCVRCKGLDELQCSHFFDRQHSGTRYDGDNCDTLCKGCHYGRADGWEHDKEGAYIRWKLRQLGPERFEAMEARARSTANRQEEIMKLMRKLAIT